jgi:type VI secretion system protein VasD
MTGAVVPKTLLTLLLCLSIAACGGGAPKPVGLVIKITASEDVNPDLQGRPSPIVLHLFELSSVESFNSLDYLGLTSNSGMALGADRLNGTQTVIAPGGFSALELQIDTRTNAIGIVAGYRDIDNATWRRAVPVVPGETDEIDVRLEQFQITTLAND